jgi:hypothetical protein
LEAAAARAEAARKFISDFDGRDFFPSEWDAADSLFNQAEQQREASTRDEAQESTALFLRAAEAFEAMRESTLRQFYEKLAGDLSIARDAAVIAGAQVIAPGFLLEADNTGSSAEEKYQSNDYYGARDTALDALNMYHAIRAGVEAYKLREEIAARAEELVPNNLTQADNTGMDAINRWEAGDYQSARAGAESALILYLRTGAAAERQRALNYRANTAVRQEFDNAQEIFTLAETAYQRRSYEDAALLFTECRPIFSMAADLALERRLAAEDALRRAEQRLAESDETARYAETILVGGAE